MVPPSLLARFGIFAHEQFLDAETCAALEKEMLAVRKRPATVRVLAQDAVDYEVDEEHRRTQMAEVSQSSMASIERRLSDLRPALEEYFSLRLVTIQPPQFLIYREGDYFHAHVDNASERVLGDRVAQRRVSVVIFVNGGNGDYEGGELTFFGLLNQGEHAQEIGIPLSADGGLLVAFRSETLHSVSPVSNGQRCTIVSWLA
jgi:predicted 2-oxoglutarate/Fe(II)-dependent dioxygenase YbiX